MALRWLEGFEVRQHSDYFGRLYTYSGSAGVLSSFGRKQGSALLSGNSSFATPALVSPVQNTWIVQVALRKSSTAVIGAGTPGVVLQNSGGDQLEMRLVDAASPDTGGYRIEVRRGATVLATSTRVFQYSDSPFWGWWVFQFKATVRTGTNGSFEVRAWDALGNQSTIVSGTTTNTANQGSDGADRVVFRVAGTTFFLDDVVVMDGSGSSRNDFTSAPVVVYGELPNADVAGELDWLPSSGGAHFSLLDDPADSPGLTDEVTSDVIGDVDLLGFSQSQLDLIPSGPTPLGIMVDIEAAMKNSGSRTIRVRVKDGVDQADASTDMVYNSTAKASRVTILEQNPTGTPADWTVAELKTVELGPKVTA